MDFKDDPPKEECVHTPDAEKYKPKLFSTSALSLGKVGLTWDESNPERAIAMKKAFEEDNDDALKAYFATSSDEEGAGENSKLKEIDGMSEEDDEAVIAKYRALLSETNVNESIDNKLENDDETGMEMTFVPESDHKAVELEKAKDKMTPWEKYLQKKKDKRKEKRQKKQDLKSVVESDGEEEIPSDVDLNDPFFKDEIQQVNKKPKSQNKKSTTISHCEEKFVVGENNLSLLVMDSDDEKSHFDYKEIVKRESKSKKAQKKAKRREKALQDDNFKLDLADSRFSAIFENPKYNVDPSHPSFKKTKSMQEIIEQKQKRISKGDKQKSSLAEEPASKRSKIETKELTSLDSLVHSVHSKTKRMKHKQSSKIKYNRK